MKRITGQRIEEATAARSLTAQKEERQAHRAQANQMEPASDESGESTTTTSWEEPMPVPDVIHGQEPLLPYLCSIEETAGEEATSLRATPEFLSRIVQELQLISSWTVKCSQHMGLLQVLDTQLQQRPRTQQQQEPQQQQHRQKNKQKPLESPPSPSTLPNLMLMQSEIEMLRGEVQLSKQEVYQRCTAQMAYLQNAYRLEHEDQVNEHHKRLDEKLGFFSQKALASIEAQQTAQEMRLVALESDVRKLKSQAQEQIERLESVETATNQSITKLAEALLNHRRDASQMYRQLEQADAAYTLALTNLKASSTESIENLKACQAQLASKVQVVRVEYQEMAEDHQRKLLQLNKLVNRMATSALGSSSPMNLMPKMIMPSSSSGASAGSSTSCVISRENSSSSCNSTENGVGTSSEMISTTSSTSNLVAKRPSASKMGPPGHTDRPKSNNPRTRTNSIMSVTAPPSSAKSGKNEPSKADCFMYAKAALSYKESATSSPSPYARQASAAQHQAPPSQSTVCSGTKYPHGLQNALVVQQSTLSYQLGREPAKSDEHEL